MLRVLVYTAPSSVAPDITRPTERITDPSLLRQTISVQSSAKANPNPGGDKRCSLKRKRSTK